MLSLICIYIHRNFIKLLSVPLLFTKDQKGGGRPVKCYDLDGFNLAYGVSQNLLENNEESDSIQYFLEILKKVAAAMNDLSMILSIIWNY